MTARFGAVLAPAGARIGAAAVASASGALAARIAATAPEIEVTIDPGAVRMSAPGIAARAFGSRRRGPDLRLLALVGGDR